MKRILAFLLMIAVSLSVLLLPCAAEASYPFYDVRKTAWYANAVRYVYQNHLFAGTDATTFSPEDYLTRAMLVSVLWRREGSPEVSEENPFWDVPDGTWYTKGVVWAASQGIVSGTGDGMFEPNANITREQLAAIMMRYTRHLSVDVVPGADLSSFADADTVSFWAREAMSWANAAGILSGIPLDGALYLDPRGNATRAQAASILQRYITLTLGIEDVWDGEIEEPERSDFEELPTFEPDETQLAYVLEVLRLVNEERAKEGIAPLELSEELCSVATLKAQDMAVFGYFKHESPNFGAPDEMLDAFGIHWHLSGENIAAGYQTPKQVMDGWMDSPGHRANILDPGYKKLGVGYFTGLGEYSSYWVQTFTD